MMHGAWGMEHAAYVTLGPTTIPTSLSCAARANIRIDWPSSECRYRLVGMALMGLPVQKSSNHKRDTVPSFTLFEIVGDCETVSRSPTTYPPHAYRHCWLLFR